MKLIGLTGPAGSGKSAVARMLAAHEGHRMVIMAFADPLKRLAMGLFGFTEEQMWGPSEKRNAPDDRYPRPHEWSDGTSDARCLVCNRVFEWADTPTPTQCFLTPRFALQTLGQSVRACLPYYWVREAHLTARSLLSNPDGCATYHRTRGLTILYDETVVARPHQGVVLKDIRHDNEARMVLGLGGEVWRVERPGAGLAGATGRHVSERGLSSSIPVRVLPNTGDLCDLRAEALRMLESAPEWNRAEPGREERAAGVPAGLPLDGGVGPGADAPADRELKGGGG